MKYEVLIHPEAERELRIAHAWFRKRSPEAAERWRSGLVRKAQTLATSPERCSLAPESEKLGEDVRQLLYGRRRATRYRLLFVIEHRTVTILHIRHGARLHLEAIG